MALDQATLAPFALSNTMRNKPLAKAARFRQAREPGTFRGRALSRQAVLLAGLFAVAVLALAGFWMHHATEQALREKLQLGLETVLDTSLASLEFWVENEISNISDWSEQPQIQTAASQLAVLSGAGGDISQQLLASPQLEALRRVLEPLVDSDNHDGFVLVGPGGTVLASVDDENVGARLTAEARTMLARVMEGEAFVTRPYERGRLLVGKAVLLDAPRMFSVAPVRDEQGNVIAALLFFIPPEKDFTRILSIARLGDTGDTYAFDKDGLMLSDSRYDDQLKAAGLIPDEPGARSILRLQVRDPGGDMTRGYTPETSPAQQPLTRLVAAAVSGDVTEQFILTPYRDYRGVEVVGAWRWVSKHGIGIATEVSAQAAFSAMRPLRMMVFGLLGLLVLSAVLILMSSFAIQFLRRRVEEVRQLGQYTLESKIGEGGMGKVYLARHALLRRPTAVKFIRADKVSEENIEHFEREVQSSSQLTHPNTIEIYDYGRTEEGIFYYVMEYLPGLTLGDLVEMEGAIPPARAIYILRQLCASLAEAHARGFVHRDVKPLNVILTERGGRFDFVKVLDFGLVRETNLPDAEHPGTVHEVAGTPPYIAPERLQDPSCMDTRSDLYSVGVIAFNLVTGKQPFEGSSAAEIAWHCVNTPAQRPADVAEQSIPAELEQLIVDCMARDPSQRPVNAESIISRLDAIATGQGWDEPAAQEWWIKNAPRMEGSARELATLLFRNEQRGENN